MADRSVLVLMTLSDLWPGFQGHDIFLKSNISKRHVLGTKLLQHTNIGIPYLIYRMVPCFVTLADLQTRRAGLSAWAELLVASRVWRDWHAQSELRTSTFEFAILTWCFYSTIARGSHNTLYNIRPMWIWPGRSSALAPYRYCIRDNFDNDKS